MNLYISNLSYNVTDADLNELFADYGEILSARVITDRETGRSRGFGFVELKDDDLAKKAIEELNQATYDEKVINVTEARPRECSIIIYEKFANCTLISIKKACRNHSAGFCSASGDRTRVSAVRGRRPRPLDECTVSYHSFHCLTGQK